MSSISSEQVEHLAKLARIKLGKSEKESLQTDLSSILKYVEQLNEVDTEKVQPTSQVTDLENVTRTDTVEHTCSSKELLDAAPKKESEQIKVSNVL